MRTIFLRPGARRSYVPHGALKDARGQRDACAAALRRAVAYIVADGGRHDDRAAILAEARQALSAVVPPV